MHDWIEGFCDYAKDIAIPERYILWSAIATVSAMLERRVWAVTNIDILMPNIYVMLVGKPGVGKTVAGVRAIDIVSKASVALQSEVKGKAGVNVSPDNLSRAGFTDFLNLGIKSLVSTNGTAVQYTAGFIFSKDFGMMVPVYDHDIIMHFTGMYDGGRYVEAKRGLKEPISLPNLCISMLACTTPSQLGGFLPAGAWEQGFMSRMLLINGEALPYRSLFAASAHHDEGAEASLIEGAKHILTRQGRIDFDEDAIASIDAWGFAGLQPVPTHPKLGGYLTRRMAHALKLSIISAASRGNESVTLADWERARDWLLEAESAMEDTLIAIASGTTDAQVIEECWNYVFKEYSRLNARRLNSPPGTPNLPPIVYVTEARVLSFLSRKLPAYAIKTVLETTIQTGMLLKKLDPKTAQTCYAPGDPPRRDQI